MRVFITGATGFIGRPLCTRLTDAGHEAVAWVRDESRARALLNPSIKLVCARHGGSIRDEIALADAVINLAGEPVFGARWTPERKRAIVESRVNLTREIIEAIAEASKRPTVLVSASAVGYYGDCGDRIVEDDSPVGHDFLAAVCRDWEAAAMEAWAGGVRVFIPRIGIVLGAGGGALAAMMLPFRFGLGGPVGSGRQFVPWIHLDDMIAIIIAAVDDGRLAGPMIAAAPNPVTNGDLAHAIGRAMGRPSLIRMPAFLLRLAFGEAAMVLCGGQRVRPRKLEQAGFRWRYPTIESALAAILKR